MEYQNTLRPQPTEEVYAAILSLENNPNFKIFTDFLAKRAISTAILSIDQVGENCHWLQGRSKELKDLSNCIKKARENFDALRRSGGK